MRTTDDDQVANITDKLHIKRPKVFYMVELKVDLKKKNYTSFEEDSEYDR